MSNEGLRVLGLAIRETDAHHISKADEGVLIKLHSPPGIRLLWRTVSIR